MLDFIFIVSCLVSLTSAAPMAVEAKAASVIESDEVFDPDQLLQQLLSNQHVKEFLSSFQRSVSEDSSPFQSQIPADSVKDIQFQHLFGMNNMEKATGQAPDFKSFLGFLDGASQQDLLVSLADIVEKQSQTGGTRHNDGLPDQRDDSSNEEDFFERLADMAEAETLTPQDKQAAKDTLLMYLADIAAAKMSEELEIQAERAPEAGEGFLEQDTSLDGEDIFLDLAGIALGRGNQRAG